jgi:hypothetical protein
MVPKLVIVASAPAERIPSSLVPLAVMHSLLVIVAVSPGVEELIGLTLTH